MSCASEEDSDCAHRKYNLVKATIVKMKLPDNKNLREKAAYLRKNSTLSEVLLWNELKNKKFYGLDFHRQKIISNYIVDFYCPSLNLVIEIDGNSHYEKYNYDINRHNYLVGLGLYVLHIDDILSKKKMNEVLGLIANVKEAIENGTAPDAKSNEWF